MRKSMICFNFCWVLAFFFTIMRLDVSSVWAAVQLDLIVALANTGKGIAGARVEIVESGRFCLTDDQGSGHIEVEGAGSYTILVEKDGFQPRVQKTTIGNKDKISLSVFLTPLATFKEEITVIARPLEMGTRELSAPQVSAIAGASEDPFKGMTTSPGIISPSEADSRLYIRGSPPWENLILLDDVPVYDPYRLFGLVTLFDPATVSYFSVWPGGFPARYGNRLSAVVEVYNRYGTTEKALSGSLNASFTNTSFLAEGRFGIVPGQASWLLTMRRTYYDILLNAMNTGPSTFPYFFDVQARFYFQPNERHEFSFFSVLSHEGTDLSEEFETDYTTVGFDAVDDQDFLIMGLHHYFHLTNNSLLTTIVSYSDNSQVTDATIVVGKEAFTSQIELDLATEEYMLQEKLEWALSQDHTLETGLLLARNVARTFLSFATDDPAVTVPPELSEFRADSRNVKFGYYMMDQWQVTDSLTVRPGVRFDYGSISGFQQWSPRLSFAYALTEQQTITGSWGYYYQFPSYETLHGEGLLYDLENLEQLDLKPERAQHYVLGFRNSVPGAHAWSVELYRKDLQDLVVGRDVELEVLVLEDDMTTRPRTIETTGIEPHNGEQGYSQGIELLYQKDNVWDDRLSFQISYSLAETRARKDNKSWHFRRYDQTHTLNLLGNLSLTDNWDLAFVWRFGSGFPYSPLGEIIVVVEDSNGNGSYDPKDGERLSYLEINDPSLQNTERFPVYHRLDARLNYTLERTLFSATFYLDIINLYDQDNVQSYEYSRDYSERKEVTGFPFLPSFGVHLTF